MRFKNTTKVPTDLLREIVRFVKPASVTNFSIWFKRAGGGNQFFFAGTAYRGRDHVVCRIPAFNRLHRPYHGGGAIPGRGYLPWNALTYEEAVVALVAHELNHLAQYRNPRLYRRTWGARGQCSERDCDAYAIRMMRAWRKAKGGCITSAPIFKPHDPGRVKPLTPHQRLEAMAKPIGIDIEFGSPSPGCIWVPAPDSLLDERGEMPNDPYESEGHTCYSYAEAKERLETYARLVKENTPDTPRVNTSINTNVVDVG